MFVLHAPPKLFLSSKVTPWKYKSGHITSAYYCNWMDSHVSDWNPKSSCSPMELCVTWLFSLQPLCTTAILEHIRQFPLLGLDLAVSSARHAIFSAVCMVHLFTSLMFSLPSSLWGRPWSLIEKLQLIPSYFLFLYHDLFSPYHYHFKSPYF